MCKTTSSIYISKQIDRSSIQIIADFVIKHQFLETTIEEPHSLIFPILILGMKRYIWNLQVILIDFPSNASLSYNICSYLYSIYHYYKVIEIYTLSNNLKKILGKTWFDQIHSNYKEKKQGHVFLSNICGFSHHRSNIFIIKYFTFYN